MKPAACFIFIFALCAAFHARAVLDIRIDQGIEQSLPIAVIPFVWSEPDSAAPLDIAPVIYDNLARSGRFTVMSEQDLPQRPERFDTINFSDWQKLGMENIVIGHITLTATGDYTVTFRLIDIFRKRQMTGFSKTVKKTQLRRVAHQISDIIFEKLIGMQGAFDTRIAYIGLHERDGNKLHTLHIADVDGGNVRTLIESNTPLLSPAWSPDGRKIAYVAFEDSGTLAIYIQDIYTGQRERITDFAGINSAPAFSPDGTKLAMTLSKDGNTEIYIMHLENRILKRLTHHIGIDTEPAWSPDGERLAFTSNRSGGPQIYEMDIRERIPRRISFYGSYNARPEYSPNGQHITLVHAVNGSYHIALLDLVDSSVNILTHTRLDESPSFSPNGSAIIYATRDIQGRRLAIVSADGRIHQKLDLLQGEAIEPAWGPFLK